MRIISISLCLMAFLATSVFFIGCGSNASDKPAESEKDHATTASCADGECGHDHGAEAGDEATHQHPSEGLHGGHLIELGDEEYHAELLQDEKTNTVTVHLLDGPAKKSVAVAQPEITLQLLRDGKFVKYTLKAVASKDATAKGTASEFTIIDEGLTEAICHDEKTQGRLQVTIDGKPYTGSIKLSCHDHGHADHDGHDGHDH